MNSKKLIIYGIKSCGGCLMRDTDGGFCTHEGAERKLRYLGLQDFAPVTPLKGLPDWCPLPDDVESGK